MLKSAVRGRIVGASPCEGVRLPKRRRKAGDDRIISREDLAGLLPHVPGRYRALVGLAAGPGLRWGECVGLRWDAVDLDAGTVRVERVAVEVAGTVTHKPYPKSKAGRREVSLPPFVVELLAAHRERYPAGPVGEVFTNGAGGPLRIRGLGTGARPSSGPGCWARSWRPGHDRYGRARAVFADFCPRYALETGQSSPPLIFEARRTRAGAKALNSEKARWRGDLRRALIVWAILGSNQ